MGGFANSQGNGQPGSGESGRDPEVVKLPPATPVSHARPSKPPDPPAERAESSTSLAPHSSPQSRPPPPTTTEWDILDKAAEHDGLGKLVAIAQTTWFIVQYLERWGAGQPKTQLEVMTLAYVVINAVISVLWMGKPRDIREPIDAGGHIISPIIPQTTPCEGWPSVVLDAVGSVDGVNSWACMTVLPIVGVLFGGIHCFALWAPFPTDHEAVLWKVSALYCTVLSLFIAIGYTPGESDLNKHVDDVDDTVGLYLASSLVSAI